MNVREMLEAAVSRVPEKIMVQYGGQQISYKEFNAQVNRAANMLLDIGVNKGDRVCMYLPNCLDFLYAWFGILKIGAILVPINNMFKKREAQYIINHCEPKAIVSDNTGLEIIKDIQQETGFPKMAISIDPDHPKDTIGLREQMDKASDSLEPTELADDDIAVILYTSGTTGYPKGCMLSQDYYRWIGYRGVDGFALDENSRTLVNMPLFHIAAQLFFVQNLLVDGSVVLLERYKPEEFWDIVCKFEINNTFMTGAMAIALERTPSHPLETQHQLRPCIGAQVPVSTQEVFIKRFNWELYECYGSTECGMALIAHRDTPRKPRAIGVPSRGVEIKLFDENDNEVPTNSPGEIVIRGSGITSGYYKNEDATAAAMRGGWFHTGDLAKKDEEGNFYYVDRSKDSIRRSSENIASVEIEDVLNAHPKISEATVLGVPDQLRGQEIMAYIIPKEKDAVTPQEIVSYCKEQLAFFKVPRYIKFVDSLPKTITGRVQKFILGEKDLKDNCFDRVAEKEKQELK